MADDGFSVPFELPLALPGFPNTRTPQSPTSIGQITPEYLVGLIIYTTKLKCSRFFELVLVEPRMLAEVELHQAWVAHHLFNQAQPPVNLPPANPDIADIRALLADGFRNVGNKLDDLTKDVKKLQTEGAATNKKIDNLTTDVKKLQADNIKLTADGVATNKKIDDLTLEVKKLQADSIKTDKRLDWLTANGATTNQKIDNLTTHVNKLQDDVNKLQDDVNKLQGEVSTLNTSADKMGEDINTLKRSARDNEASLTDLNRTVTDLPTTEGFKQAISASIRENETITEIQNTVNQHTRTLRNVQQTSANTLEKLTRLQRGIARADRVQCQIFNASRVHSESWLPICNEDGVLPSERDLVEVRSRVHLDRLESRDIADLLVFYGRIPSDFPIADTPVARATNFVRQSRTWPAHVQRAHLRVLSDIFTSSITSFSASL